MPAVPSVFSIQGNASDQDQEAVLGFMSAIATYDPAQSLPTSWKQNVSVCEWTGITCGRGTQRVVTVDVGSMGLQGTISPLLGNLSFLIILDLRNNSFHGHIPYQLGSLFRLKMLALSANQIQGSIPPTLGGCRSLTIFSMYSNHLDGNIPSEMCVLSKLQYMALEYNNLTGTIPGCLGNMSSLNYINLKNNTFHGSLPSELGMLSLLRRLNLWNNRLTGKIPSSLSNCTNLLQLNLCVNRLTGPIPEELCSKNTGLLGIHMLGNQLSGSIPASLFNCTKLQVIELGENQFSGVLPMELGKLTQLQYLDLYHNQLVSGSTTSLPILSALTNCSSLQLLNLASNYLTGSLPFSIGQLSTTLIFMYLNDNELAGEIPPQIGNLTSLTFLKLDKNSFTGAIPSSFNMLQKLERLYLGSNNLRGTIPTEIGQLKSLGLLDLRENNLSGRIPDSLAHLQQLIYLNLNQNQLSGNIPASLGKWAMPLELSKMTMVQAIDVSANQLTGDLPSTLESCKELAYLNLSCNALEGLIPVSLGELQNLQNMDLSSNNLSGRIPMSLEKLKMLSHLNFSSNQLSSEVPKGGVFKKLGATAFMGNVGLCGSWVNLPPCSVDKHKSHSHLKIVIIYTIVVTAVIVLCFLLCIWWRSQNQRPIVREARESLNVGYRRISYEELVTATDEFSDANLLGVGSFGKVYRGVLNDGIGVAIKLLSLENNKVYESFYKERDVLSKVRHRNLIRVIAAYSNLQIKALIFPLMPNGSLEKWLYPDNDGEGKITEMSLIQRFKIAIDIAHGLAYLHHHCFVQIIHCDLKPSNVLIGEDMTAYLIDFGIATICYADSEDSDFTSTYTLKGSIGYIPPEYGIGIGATTKCDVYGYGIILLEIFTGKRPTHKKVVEGMNLHKWVRNGFQNRLEEVIDENILNTNATEKEFHCLSRLVSMGLLCTQESPQERPNMMDVVKTLQSIQEHLLRAV
eukprot:PITA_10013